MHSAAAQSKQHHLGVKGQLFERGFEFFGGGAELLRAFAKRLRLIARVCWR